jgi:hypothetical protein
VVQRATLHLELGMNVLFFPCAIVAFKPVLSKEEEEKESGVDLCFFFSFFPSLKRLNKQLPYFHGK